MDGTAAIAIGGLAVGSLGVLVGLVAAWYARRAAVAAEDENTMLIHELATERELNRANVRLTIVHAQVAMRIGGVPESIVIVPRLQNLSRVPDVLNAIEIEYDGRLYRRPPLAPGEPSFQCGDRIGAIRLIPYGLEPHKPVEYRLELKPIDFHAPPGSMTPATIRCFFEHAEIQREDFEVAG